MSLTIGFRKLTYGVMQACLWRLGYIYCIQCPLSMHLTYYLNGASWKLGIH